MLLYRSTAQRDQLASSDAYSLGQLSTLETLSPVTSDSVYSLDAFSQTQPGAMNPRDRVLAFLSMRMGDVAKYVARLLINALQVCCAVIQWLS